MQKKSATSFDVFIIYIHDNILTRSDVTISNVLETQLPNDIEMLLSFGRVFCTGG